jgi:hypothetical protein
MSAILGLWDLAGALTLPGLVEPHAHLDKTFTIERCRPAQMGHAIRCRPGQRGGRPTLNIRPGPMSAILMHPPRWPGRQRMA